MNPLNIKNSAAFTVIHWRVMVLALIGQVGTVQATTNCLISAATYQQMARKQSFTIIDTRSKKDYQQYWIENSINLPSTQIKTKTYLKGKAMLLVGTGKFNDSLLALCQQLKADGFNGVYVLDNGLIAWQKALGPVQGDPLSQKQMMQLSSAELFNIRNKSDWRVIYTGNEKRPLTKLGNPLKEKFFEQAIFIGDKDSKTDFDHSFNALKESCRQPNRLVVMGDEPKFKLIERKMLNTNCQVFHYAGDVDRLLLYVERQERIANKRTFTLQKRRSCQN